MRGWTGVLRAVQQRSSSATSRSTATLLRVNTRALATGHDSENKEGGGSGSSSNNGSRMAAQSLAAAAAAALVAAALDDRLSVRAEVEEEAKALRLKKENKVRQYQTPDMVFTYFATYRKSGSKGLWANLMSPLDLYSALTPDCNRFGSGQGDYVEVTEEDLASMVKVKSKVKVEASPVQNSILNKIGRDGLLTYPDFCFLLGLISTPPRYIETAFRLFDVNGNESINLKEFAYVSTKNALKFGGFGAYDVSDEQTALNAKSGLLNYMFGINRNSEITKDQFKQLQKDLLNELIELQFLEFDKENKGRISEEDFANFLLKNGKIPKKKKANLLKNVKSKWPTMGQGISFDSFKNFFYVLAGGGELERALFYLDVEQMGVSPEEFRKVSSWVSGADISVHVTDVIFTLLDDDGDGRLQRSELAHVLLDWRNSRGLDKVSLIQKKN